MGRGRSAGARVGLCAKSYEGKEVKNEDSTKEKQVLLEIVSADGKTGKANRFGESRKRAKLENLYWCDDRNGRVMCYFEKGFTRLSRYNGCKCNKFSYRDYLDY